jgi:hypothetical protein
MRRARPALAKWLVDSHPRTHKSHIHSLTRAHICTYAYSHPTHPLVQTPTEIPTHIPTLDSLALTALLVTQPTHLVLEPTQISCNVLTSLACFPQVPPALASHALNCTPPFCSAPRAVPTCTHMRTHTRVLTPPHHSRSHRTHSIPHTHLQCTEGGPDMIETQVDVTAVSRRCQEGNPKVKVAVSTDAGLYLCEYIYYRSMRHLGVPAIFVHVPPVSCF